MLISIPMFISRNAVVQSLSTFIFMLIYMFFVVYLQPMHSLYLNKVEILSCIGVMVGAFTSVFFVVELNGAPLLNGATKEFVGLVMVTICAVAFFLSAKYIYQDFSRLFVMYRIVYSKSWVLEISSRLGAAATEGAYIPLVATLFNKFASQDVFKLKRNMRLQLLDLHKCNSVHSNIFARVYGALRAAALRMRLSFRARLYKPPPDLLDKCMKEPELDALVYLQKLGERVASWDKVSWKYWNVHPKQLPVEFREVKGYADPPHSEYVYQSNVIHMLEDALPPRVHRVLTSLLFSQLMVTARSNLTPTERE
jgi:hypothetical protein